MTSALEPTEALQSAGERLLEEGGDEAKEEAKEEKPEEERGPPPSRLLLVVFSTAATLFGGSAMAIPHLTKGAEKGLHWYKVQLRAMLMLHGACALVCVAVGWPLVKQADANLRGQWYRQTGVEHRWDTVKWTLTSVVAFSHFGLAFYQQRWFQVFNTFKEAWLMQSYFFISGYLSTPEVTRARLQSLWRSLVGAYVVNQLGLYFEQWLIFEYGWHSTPLPRSVEGEFVEPKEYTRANFLITIWTPLGALWYLPNLITARLVAPFWMELRWPLLLSLVMCVLVLSLNAQDFNLKLAWLDVNSWLTMFPFYILGIKARRVSAALDAALEWPGARLAAAASFLTFLCFCYVNESNTRREHRFGIGAQLRLTNDASPADWTDKLWFDADTTRLTLSFQDIVGAKGSRLLTYSWYMVVGGDVARVALIFSVVLLFSRKERLVLGWPGTWAALDITALGKRSISNYIMHCYLFIALNLTWIETDQHYGTGKIILVIAISILQSNFWMCKPVYDVIKPIFLAPSMDWLLLDKPSKPDSKPTK